MNKNAEYLYKFLTPIQISDLELNIDSLIEFCYEMKQKNKKGVKLTNMGGWHSDNVLNETNSEFVKLKNKIEENANKFHHQIELKKTLKQKLSNIWININPKGGSNDFHDHPGSCFSGAFYLKGEAPIIFQHPYKDITTYFWKESIIEKWNSANSGQWRYKPEPNVLLLFPGWLEHKVLMNSEETDRISISFNTTI